MTPLPILPPKKFWKNTAESFIEDRQIALETALEQLACVPAAFTRDDVLDFLGVPKGEWAEIKGGASSK